MNKPRNEDTGYTDRRSGRVDLPGGSWPGQRKIDGKTGPESTASAASFASAVPAEGGGLRHRVLAQTAAHPLHTGTGQLRSLRSSLSSRDWLVLQSFDQHPYLTTAQLQRLHFADHATPDSAGRVCRRVLRRLVGVRVLQHLERRVGGVRAGSASFVFQVGPVGDRLLRERQSDPVRARRKEPSLRYLDHCLLAAETHIQLLEASNRRALDVIRVETEPRCWRPYLAPSPARRILKPDLYAVTSMPDGDYEDHWFIEVDRATESVPTLLRKCAQYDEYRRSDVEQERHGVFPLTLWVMPDERRIKRLQHALAAARSVDGSLHRMTTLPGLITAVRGEPS